MSPTTKRDYDRVLKSMTDMSGENAEVDFLGMFYGNSGVGKTTYVMDLAQELRGDGWILYLDSSDGWVSLKQRPDLREGAKRLEFREYEDLGLVSLAVLNQQKGFEGCTVVVVDEFSSISQDVLSDVVRQQHGLSADDLAASPEWTDHSPMQGLMLRALNNLHRAKGVQVILVSHEREDVVKRETYTSPDFSKKFRNKIYRPMHVVARLTARTKSSNDGVVYTHELQFQPTTYTDAKTRIPGLSLRTGWRKSIDTIADWTFEGGPEKLPAKEEEQEVLEEELPADNLTEDDEPISTEEME